MSAPGSDAKPGTRERVNWAFALGSFFAGAVLLLASLWLEKYHRWQGVSESAFIDGGVALLLVTVLSLLERRLVSTVSTVAAAAASEAVSRRVEESAQGLSTRLDELGARMDALASERAERQDESVRALAVPTARLVATALAEANRLGALAHGTVTVQGSIDYRELGLHFSYGRQMGDGRFGAPARDVLRIRGVLYADQDGSGPKPFIEVEWGIDEEAEAVGFRLREQLERGGRWHGEDTLNWPFALANLQSALDLAIRSRRRDNFPGLLRGALIEMVGDWAITGAGLENPRHGYVLDEGEFPKRYAMPRRGRTVGEEWKPDRPDWAVPDAWDELLRRARQVLPALRGPLGMAPTWVPLSEPPGVGS